MSTTGKKNYFPLYVVEFPLTNYKYKTFPFGVGCVYISMNSVLSFTLDSFLCAMFAEKRNGGNEEQVKELFVFCGTFLCWNLLKSLFLLA